MVTYATYPIIMMSGMLGSVFAWYGTIEPYIASFLKSRNPNSKYGEVHQILAVAAVAEIFCAIFYKKLITIFGYKGGARVSLMIMAFGYFLFSVSDEVVILQLAYSLVVAGSAILQGVLVGFMINTLPNDIGLATSIGICGFPLALVLWNFIIKLFLNPNDVGATYIVVENGIPQSYYPKEIAENVPLFYKWTALIQFSFAMVGYIFIDDPPGTKSVFWEWLQVRILNLEETEEYVEQANNNQEANRVSMIKQTLRMSRLSKTDHFDGEDPRISKYIRNQSIAIARNRQSVVNRCHAIQQRNSKISYSGSPGNPELPVVQENASMVVADKLEEIKQIQQSLMVNFQDESALNSAKKNENKISEANKDNNNEIPLLTNEEFHEAQAEFKQLQQEDYEIDQKIKKHELKRKLCGTLFFLVMALQGIFAMVAFYFMSNNKKRGFTFFPETFLKYFMVFLAFFEFCARMSVGKLLDKIGLEKTTAILVLMMGASFISQLMVPNSEVLYLIGAMVYQLNYGGFAIINSAGVYYYFGPEDGASLYGIAVFIGAVMLGEGPMFFDLVLKNLIGEGPTQIVLIGFMVLMLVMLKVLYNMRMNMHLE